jgi:hypothetical protein
VAAKRGDGRVRGGWRVAHAQPRSPQENIPLGIHLDRSCWRLPPSASFPIALLSSWLVLYYVAKQKKEGESKGHILREPRPQREVWFGGSWELDFEYTDAYLTVDFFQTIISNWSQTNIMLPLL